MDRFFGKLCCLPLPGPQVRDLSDQLNLVTAEQFLAFDVSSGLVQGFKGLALRSSALEPYPRFRPLQDLKGIAAEVWFWSAAQARVQHECC